MVHVGCSGCMGENLVRKVHVYVRRARDTHFYIRPNGIVATYLPSYVMLLSWPCLTSARLTAAEAAVKLRLQPYHR